MKPEDFDLDSGLANDFDAAITDVWFDKPSEQYAAKSGGASDPRTYLKLESSDLTAPIEQSYSTGTARQWQVVKNGAELVSGKDANLHRFVSNSRTGTLVERMITLIGKGDKKKGQEFFIQRGYFMTQREFYVGLNFHWMREKQPTLDGESEVLLPVAYLGEVAVKAKDATPSASASSDEDTADLIALAIGKTEQQIKRTVVTDPAFKGKDSLKRAVLNQGLLAELVKQGKLALVDGKYDIA